MICIFGHKFDPEKWKEISCVPIRAVSDYDGEPLKQPRSLGMQRVFSNTCTKCGDLIFRRVTEIEP